ncbi:hypothetical protein PF006_g17135 [Phytophthora fragariae]|uniref:Uncharacterized protein n=2 Tax=Phytophthora fragariae TaxID=53985 RepID=A0A6A3T1B2_9STRA|nr:hypothetical protein PF006_g17135 [Phytophthora fragariae]
MSIESSSNQSPFFFATGMLAPVAGHHLPGGRHEPRRVVDAIKARSQKTEVAFDRDEVPNKQQTLQQLTQDAGKATFSHVVEPGDDDSLELKFTVAGMS